LPCDFYLSSFFFPRLISAVGDWMSTILPRLSVNLECMSKMCCTRLAENTGRKKSPSRHHCTPLLGHIFATKLHIDHQEKNLLNTNTSSTCPHNMVNFGSITAENCWRVWGTPANFNRFCVLAALLRGTPAAGISQTLWR